MSDKMKTPMAVFTGLIIGLLSGVGIFQISIAGEVAKHDVKIIQLETATLENRRAFDERLGNLLRLVEVQVAAERELISLVREQIRILERTTK